MEENNYMTLSYLTTRVTEQFAVSQVANWSTRGQVNSLKHFDLKLEVNNHYKYDLSH